jgi:hypothetical protein
MMENNDYKKKKHGLKPEIKGDQRLNLSYDKAELQEAFPNLVSEMGINGSESVNKARIPENRKIKLTESDTEKFSYEESLSNPGVIDFLRRCVSSEDAISIIEYLKSRNELPSDLYEKLLKVISQEGGLQKLIKDCGGLKEPGYYVDKYYNQD